MSEITSRLDRARRVLIYSHDTFGLGHLRRCREIAHALVEADRDMSVLILSGSPIIGSFDFSNRVDFVRIPGVIKLRDGNYVPLKLPLGIDQTLAMRASIIQHTADVFDPDLLIVDKEPLGLRGEVRATLSLLRSKGVPCVLGLRDVMDDPRLLAPEWERKKVAPALTAFYDHIWVYGLPQICRPLDGINLPPSIDRRITYTGYLKRNPPKAGFTPRLEKIKEPYILVTVGGGGDGEAIIDWVLQAYEHDPNIPYPALLVLGPFMGTDLQADFQARVDLLSNVEAITFNTQLEGLMARAVGVVSMGGYNTFCELLSFDKRALIIPRTEPRLEQSIRAEQAQQLGLVRMLSDDGIREPTVMSTALRTLAQQPLPSQTVVPGLLDGRDNLVKLARQWLDRVRQPLGLQARR